MNQFSIFIKLTRIYIHLFINFSNNIQSLPLFLTTFKSSAFYYPVMFFSQHFYDMYSFIYIDSPLSLIISIASLLDYNKSVIIICTSYLASLHNTCHQPYHSNKHITFTITSHNFLPHLLQHLFYFTFVLLSLKLYISYK